MSARCAQAAVDAQRLVGDGVGFRASKERCGIGNVLAMHRKQHAFAQVLDHALAMVSFKCWRAPAPARLGVSDVAHRHRVDTDAAAAQFARQHVAHLHYAAGRSAYEKLADGRYTARFGADGEDAFTSACEFQSDGSRSRCDLKFTHKEIIA